MSETKIVVKLVGEDGNAYNIIGRVRAALIKNSRGDLAEKFMAEATSGDYDHFLQTAIKYVKVK